MLLLRALLGAIEETIAWVLELFKNYYNVRVPYKDDPEFGPQVYLKITVIFCGNFFELQIKQSHLQERHLHRGINIGSFDLKHTRSDELADIGTRHLAAWLDSNKEIEVNRSFQLRKNVVPETAIPKAFFPS